jgi:long-chain acyl-CoA synthetase
MDFWERLEARLSSNDIVIVDHRDGRTCITGRALSKAIEGFAANLRATSARRVGLCAPNSTALVAAFLGSLRAGCSVVPFHAGTPPAELAARMIRFGVDVRLDEASLADPTLLSAPPQATLEGPARILREGRKPADPAASPLCNPEELSIPFAPGPALLLGTSGTTGEPRAVAISREALARHTASLVDHVLGLGPDDRVLLALPLAHSYGCRMGLLAPLLAGAVIHLVPRFSAHATLALLEAERITWTPVVPTMLSAWAALPGPPLPSLRWVLSAGAPLPEALRMRAVARLGCEVREGYGLTEASFATVDVPPCVPGSVGPPVPGVEVRIRDGEVELRGDNVMDGYLDDPEGTAATFSADGWLKTGDLGELIDGRLHLLDRKKDIILRGGQTIYPAEVERALAMHPALESVAVIGVPDAHLGERVAACCVGRHPLDFAELEGWARTQLAAYKVPEVWRQLDALPVGSTGKVLRRALRASL